MTDAHGTGEQFSATMVLLFTVLSVESTSSRVPRYGNVELLMERKSIDFFGASSIDYPLCLQFACYYFQPEDLQQQIIRETFHLVSKRDDNVCNFLEGGT